MSNSKDQLDYPKSRAELDSRLKDLPESIHKVYEQLQHNLTYQEPGNSDVTADKIAENLDLDIRDVFNALILLEQVKLIYYIDWHRLGEPEVFLHTYEHDLEL